MQNKKFKKNQLFEGLFLHSDYFSNDENDLPHTSQHTSPLLENYAS